MGLNATRVSELAITDDSEPFRGSGLAPVAGGSPAAPALDASGYVEAEYLVSGDLSTGPYATTLLLRRPQDAAAFSGVVLVEPVHAVGPVPMWAFSDYLLAHGHGYAMVVAQRSTLEEFLRPRPDRYPNVHIPLATDRDEAANASTGDLADRLRGWQAQAPVSCEILVQVGRALVDADIFGEPARWLVVGGASQSAMLTLELLNGDQGAAQRADGSPVFSGYFPTSTVGSVVADVGVPVVHLVNEGDLLGQPPPDGAGSATTPSPLHRRYEVAGSSHISTRGFNAAVDNPRLANIQRSFSGRERFSEFPHQLPRVAALDNLLRWVVDGVPAPTAGLIQRDEQDKIVRDEHGNARGGLRTSCLDVPVARYDASRPAEGAAWQWIFGVEAPFESATLRRLYGSEDTYVERAASAIEELVDERWLRADDAELLRAEAKAFTF